jgi:sugar lactone lactonase YvrE
VAGIVGSGSAAANRLNVPYGIAFDSSDTLYIADQSNNRIQKWPPGASNGTTVAGQANGAWGATASTLQSPTSVLVDSSNNIYVVDSSNHRIQLWLNGSSSGTTIAGNGRKARKVIV